MKVKLYQLIIRLLNGKRVSNILLAFAQSKASKFMIKPYAKYYKIHIDEAKKTIEEFNSLHDFFTRHVKAEARPIEKNSNHVISPVDGVLAEFGTISHEHEMIVKNKPYSISEMLGSKESAEKYIDGTFLVIYLSPANYHRIHAPYDAAVVRTYELGSRSYPVNAHGLKYGDSTLAKNYRVVTELQKNAFHFASVKVGAMFVNSIVMTNHNSIWSKGEEVAYFSFGSTVVLLFEKNSFTLHDHLEAQSELKMGMSIGTFAH